MNLMESLMTQKLMGVVSGTSGSGHSPVGPTECPAWEGQFTPASDTYQPAPISVPGEWDHMLIWTEESFLIGRRNISGTVIWKSNSTLAYKVMYTNNTGTAGIVSQLLGGGPLYSAQGNDLLFGADISFGVYAAGTTYKWIAWKEVA